MRNSRGRGLPGCGRGVTVPTSMKPKPSARKGIDVHGVLVEAGGEADRIGKVQPHRAYRARRERGLRQEGREPEADLVSGLGIEREEERSREPIQAQPAAQTFASSGVRRPSRRHAPPTKPSIGSNLDLYAIFGLSRIQ